MLRSFVYPTAYKEPFAPPVYAYEYAVNDDYAGTKFGQNEKRDGYLTAGAYRVALPGKNKQNYNRPTKCKVIIFGPLLKDQLPIQKCG